MFFEMFGTVTIPVPLKNWMLIPLREMYLLSKFGKRSSSTSRSMTVSKITWPCQYYIINTCEGLRLDTLPRDVFAV